jgi:ParB-like chromosome segregation protein Spo0J
MDVHLTALRPHPQNYNQHSEDQIGRLIASLETFGQAKDIVIWAPADGAGWWYTIAGHGLVEAALRKGWTTLRATDKTMDWTETEAVAYLAADNELARLADPDEAALAALAASLANVDAELAALAVGTEERLRELLDAITTPRAEDWSDAFAGLPTTDRSPFQQMTFTLHDDQVDTVKEALQVAKGMGAAEEQSDNANSNGNALALICETFLTDHGQS